MGEHLAKFEHWTLKVHGQILHIVITAKELNIEIAKLSVEQRVNFSKGVSYPCLFDLREVKNVTKEARDFLAIEGNNLVTASALLINSPVNRMIGNFFVTVNKPKNPTRLFTNKDDALEWLKQFKSEKMHDPQNNSN